MATGGKAKGPGANLTGLSTVQTANDAKSMGPQNAPKSKGYPASTNKSFNTVSEGNAAKMKRLAQARRDGTI
jgi:hypothetical protein